MPNLDVRFLGEDDLLEPNFGAPGRAFAKLLRTLVGSQWALA